MGMRKAKGCAGTQNIAVEEQTQPEGSSQNFIDFRLQRPKPQIIYN